MLTLGINGVPYNSYLSRKYNTHVSVEMCSQIQVIKCFYKYIHKGPDQTTIIIEESRQSEDASRALKYKEVDEIK